MNSGEEIESLFKGVSWTGNSSIHRSHFMEKVLPIVGAPQKIMTMIVHGKMPEQLWDMYFDLFPEVEWLLNGEEFKVLTLLDIYRHLMGQGDSHSEKKLKNPATGNVFHRLCLRGKFVGGIRFWTHNHYEERTVVGWRFRWEKQDEAEETTRIKTRNKVDVAIEEWEAIQIKLDIPEPTEDQISENAGKVRVITED